MDYALALFPPEKLGFILLIALAVFALTQTFKWVFRKTDRLPELNQTVLRLLAVASAFPLTYGIWPVRGWLSITPIALIAFGLAHLTAKYGMSALKEFAPRWYRVLNAEPENRREDVGPKRGKYDRRREV